MTRHVSSEKARANWRAILDTVATGETVIIERYGEPVARLSPILNEAETKAVRETASVYQTLGIEEIKQEIIAEVLAELTARRETPRSWREELAALQASIAAHGGLNVGETTEEIVEHMRRTRQEVWDEEEAGAIAQQVREQAIVYSLDLLTQLQADIVKQVVAEMEAHVLEPLPWSEGLADIQRLERESGSPFAGMTTEEIVERMRETRREITEVEYAHLYR